MEEGRKSLLRYRGGGKKKKQSPERGELVPESFSGKEGKMKNSSHEKTES